MAKRMKVISPERAVHIIDGLLLWWSEHYMASDYSWVDKDIPPDKLKDLNKLLSDINNVAHIASRPMCEDVHQHKIPEIRQMERALIKAGMCTPFNQRGWKYRIKERRHHKKSEGEIRG